MAKDLAPKPTIPSLVAKIKQEILTGKQNIEKTIENEKTITYWNIGKHIHEHLLHYEDRAEFGEYLFKELAGQLQIGKSTLYRTVQFYETYPEIVATWRQLTWSHYKLLLTVKDEEKRKEYEQKIIHEDLSVLELKELIKKENEEQNSDKNPQLTEKRGILSVYKVRRLKNRQDTEFYIDMGFGIYLDKLDNDNNNYSEESIVRIRKELNTNTFIIMEEIPPDMLFTYKGYIDEIVDGDTIWINVDLGLEAWTRKKLRLRGINAAGIETKEGKKARDFIKAQLSPCEFVIVKTYWRDKFNRYLADIFYDKNETDGIVIAEKGVFLNQLLLDKGLAKKYQ